MTDRRTVLKLLGLGGAAVGVGGFAALETGLLGTESVDQEPTSLAELKSTVAFYAPDPNSLYSQFTFDYEPLEASYEDPYFSRVIAKPSQSPPGDRIRIDSTGGEPATVAALLRGQWAIGTATQIETEIGGRPVTLRGGTSPYRHVAALLGVVRSEGGGTGSVLAVRGATSEDATQLARDLSPLSTSNR